MTPPPLASRIQDAASEEVCRRSCLTNNAAERALRGFALGRKSWLFAVPNVALTAPLS